MSITDEIQKRIRTHRDKRLFYLPLAVPSDLHIRTMIVSVEVKDAVTNGFPKNWEGKRRAEFRGALDAFTDGQFLSVAEKPFNKPPDTDLARVHPATYEIWDIRSTNPEPGIRCFGGFGGKDLFIALTWNYRESICGKERLGIRNRKM